MNAGGSLPLELVCMGASQINGCSACVDMHSRTLKKAGEADERIFAIAAWREAAYFTDAERAALALSEAVTRLSDRADPVPATRSRLTVDFVVAGDRLRACIDKGNLDFDRNPSGPADVVIRGDAAAIARLANKGRVS